MSHYAPSDYFVNLYSLKCIIDVQLDKIAMLLA